jgi:flagellar assembly protein FliH
MSLSHRYPDFSPIGIDPGALMTVPEDGLEELKLESFEDGYKAGWEDSSKAHATDYERAILAISQRLEDLSFTHAEAIVKVAEAMQPLLSKITCSLLPDIAKNALGTHVVEQLENLLKDEAEESIEIAVAPENLLPLQQVLENQSNTSFRFVAEPLLTSGQVYLRASRAEREINLDAVRVGIAAAVDAFFVQTQEERHHG